MLVEILFSGISEGLSEISMVFCRREILNGGQISSRIA
jgi:hypothetical protein